MIETTEMQSEEVDYISFSDILSQIANNQAEPTVEAIENTKSEVCEIKALITAAPQVLHRDQATHHSSTQDNPSAKSQTPIPPKITTPQKTLTEAEEYAQFLYDNF
ncbi:MAG: hypothetical protein R3Y07_07710 [Eubacteriales bacterium]